ncbi:MAG: ATP-binding protein [Candidatus Latescibacteria bacterium]|nr:ATP-binding protein [Candidatus Latescibacterota bacterium]
MLRIAIASGKGGTGKTTVATNLAWVIASQNESVTYVDCDVEEPNGHMFLNPVIEESTVAKVPYPVINEETCISCGKCAEICQYRAIIMLAENPYVSPEMCHACGGCWLVCPVDAVKPAGREIGIIEKGKSEHINFIHGKLSIGQILSPPLIRMVKKHISGDGITLIDCPPGTSCPVLTSVQGADYIILVTEPTPFGLNDLKLAIDMIGEIGIPIGVFINRADIGTNDTERYCEQRHIDIIGRLNDNRTIAEAYSQGKIASKMMPEIRGLYENLYTTLKRKIHI